MLDVRFVVWSDFTQPSYRVGLSMIKYAPSTELQST